MRGKLTRSLFAVIPLLALPCGLRAEVAVTDPGRTHSASLGIDGNIPATTALDTLQNNLIAVALHIFYG